jgi:hypothetical protein
VFTGHIARKHLAIINPSALAGGETFVEHLPVPPVQQIGNFILFIEVIQKIQNTLIESF